MTEPTALPARLPTLYIPHGGGPRFFMDPPADNPRRWIGMADYLLGLDAMLGFRPKALVVASAHWEEPVVTVNTAARPTLYYDYYNFPPHTYRLQYPAPGEPALARRVAAMLRAAGIDCAEEDKRGWDHGIFIPFKLVYPDADVPIVELSLRADFDPEAHLAVGRALAPLREEGVLIIGSGQSLHNRMLGDGRFEAARRFDDWLTEAATAEPATRDAMLARWASAPNARDCHAREEHLLPLMVAAGAAGGDRGRRTFHELMDGLAHSGFTFG